MRTILLVLVLANTSTAQTNCFLALPDLPAKEVGEAVTSAEINGFAEQDTLVFFLYQAGWPMDAIKIGPRHPDRESVSRAIERTRPILRQGMGIAWCVSYNPRGGDILSQSETARLTPRWSQ